MNINEVQQSNTDTSAKQVKTDHVSAYSSNRNSSKFSYYIELSKTNSSNDIENYEQEDENTNDEENVVVPQENDANPNLIYIQMVQNMNNELFDMRLGQLQNDKNENLEPEKFNLDLSDLTLNDIKLFEGLTQKSDVAINSVDSKNQTFNMNINGENIDVSYKSVEVSKTLFAAIDNASKTGKPVRIDFGKDTSVILKIGKDGKLSADFIPNEKAMELALKNALPNLKAKFEEENIPYGTLNYKQFNQQKDKQNNHNKERNKDE